jgi:hypothetical protein
MIHYMKWAHELGIIILMVYLMETIMTLLLIIILIIKSYFVMLNHKC